MVSEIINNHLTDFSLPIFIKLYNKNIRKNIWNKQAKN